MRLARLPLLYSALIFFVVAVFSEAQNLTTYSHQFKNFNTSFYGILRLEGNAAISNNALQLTPDSASPDFRLVAMSGRVMLNQPFKLWAFDKNNSRVASFNTSFLLNIYPLSNETPGEGLTFLIDSNTNPPPNSCCQYLGMTDSIANRHSQPVVAVEFDTFKQNFDPDANHVGLNIGSIISVKTVSLSPLGIELVPKGARFYNVWIQYDGVKKVIEVYIAEQPDADSPTPSIPSTPVLKSELELRGNVHQYSYIGFSASTGDDTIQLNCILRWNLSVEYFPDSRNDENKPEIIILKDKNKQDIILRVGVPVSTVVVLLTVAGLGYYLIKRQMMLQSNLNNILEALKMLPGAPKEFEFRDLKKATNNFNEKNKLGQGGFGVVYKGILPKENLEIAVKWFSRESIKGQDDFMSELTIINRLRH